MRGLLCMSLNKCVFSGQDWEGGEKVPPLVSYMKSWGGERVLPETHEGNTAPPCADQCLSHILQRHVLSFSLMSYKMV